MLVYKLPSDRSRNSRKSFPLSIDIIPTFRKKTATIPLLAAGVCALKRHWRQEKSIDYFSLLPVPIILVIIFISDVILLCYDCRHPHLPIEFPSPKIADNYDEYYEEEEEDIDVRVHHIFFCFLFFFYEMTLVRICNQQVISFCIWCW